jgi:hypothetical protein
MRIRLFVKFDVKPRHVEMFIEHMQVAKSELIKVPGCESVELIQCVESPTKVFLSKIWVFRKLKLSIDELYFFYWYVSAFFKVVVASAVNFVPPSSAAFLLAQD